VWIRDQENRTGRALDLLLSQVSEEITVFATEAQKTQKKSQERPFFILTAQLRSSALKNKIRFFLCFLCFCG